MVSLSHFTHSSRSVILSHCGFTLQFLNDYDDVKCLFMSLLTIHTSSLETGQYKSFANFKNWVVCCLLNIVSSLYILDMNMY